MQNITIDKQNAMQNISSEKQDAMQNITQEEQSILSGIRLFLLDLDGTVYLDGKLIDGARDAVFAMSKRAQILYLTNNSSRPQSDYVQKLTDLGLPQPHGVYTSANATQDFLLRRHKNSRVYLFGNECVRREFLQRGINVCDDKPDVVVVAFNTEYDYSQIKKLCRFVSDGAEYIATHPDKVCPIVGGSIPDAGSILSLVKAATGRRPSVICGKPYATMAKGIAALTGVEAGQTAMVGDRLYTDIKFAALRGYASVLVLTGETSAKTYAAQKQKSDLVLPSIADITRYF